MCFDLTLTKTRGKGFSNGDKGKRSQSATGFLTTGFLRLRQEEEEKSVAGF